MEYYGRRNRRGRGRPAAPLPVHFAPRPQKNSFLNGLCSFLIMSSLIAITYYMLDYHCQTCSNKGDLFNITRGISDIAKNLSIMKNSYNDLELQIMKFSHELPKIEGQLDILEALANTMERGDYTWNPKTHLALPNVKVFLNKPEESIVKNPYSVKTKLNLTTTQD